MNAIPTLPPIEGDLAHRVVGLWRLISREDHDDEGVRRIDPVMGPNPLGMLVFGPSRFAAQFMNPDRSAAPSVAVSSGPNNSGAVNGYDAYFGSYTLDAAVGKVTVKLEGGLSVANIGQAFVRDIRADQRNLWIQLRTSATDGTPVTRTLTFVRDGTG
ncbi:MAG TPA: lipocalin-like domain-containing protein [Gemmatimonadales bacterium]|nr:lipocalin-like domain-containing protein [Gemmatimonadales bacterium]